MGCLVNLIVTVSFFSDSEADILALLTHVDPVLFLIWFYLN